MDIGQRNLALLRMRVLEYLIKTLDYQAIGRRPIFSNTQKYLIYIVPGKWNATTARFLAGKQPTIRNALQQGR